MIGDPVMLTIRRNIERPSKALLKSFDGMPTGFVTDAYNGKGCLDFEIKPNSAFKHGPGEVNMGVSCGGVAIGPGDIIVGDRDGVVAVPLAQAEQVAAQLEVVRKKEAEAEARVKSGETLKFWDPAALGSRVRYID